MPNTNPYTRAKQDLIEYIALSKTYRKFAERDPEKGLDALGKNFRGLNDAVFDLRDAYEDLLKDLEKEYKQINRAAAVEAQKAERALRDG